METLTSLFGTESKVRVIRLFLFSQSVPFFLKEVAYKSKCSISTVKRELAILVKADLIRKRKVTKEVQLKRGRSITVKKVKGIGYILNEKFPYLNPLKTLLTVASIQADESLTKRFSSAGRIKYLVAAGVFIQNWDSRVDLLIVGEELNLIKVEAIIKTIEADIGKEVSYSAFDTQDFEYRLGIHDRLVRDILDYPHVTLIDKLGVV
ncbi:MAG: hypothetical protein WCO48_01195 [Candidatus Taylorbacteria bacterium]